LSSNPCTAKKKKKKASRVAQGIRLSSNPVLQKKKKEGCGDEEAQMEEHWPSKHEALNSNSSTTKRNKNKNRKPKIPS
jgi:hypothetical protein